jgi:hypothetical protein
MILYRKKYLLPYLITFGMVLFAGFSYTFSDHPQTGFWAMEGTLVTHHFEEKTDSLSGPELFELQDENGLPIWFGRHIFKDVCISGECKMIRLWLFWDGAGNYLGLQTPEEEPLTKSDHTPFEPEDYEKLEYILHDPTSVLKDLKPEDLIIVPDTIDLYKAYEVDGYTAATQPALTEVVVKDAVYTCYTLWHTVYGPPKNAIDKILEQRLNEEFLTKMFASENPSYASWAIKTIQKHPEYHEAFYPTIIELIKSGSSDLSKQAMDYFQPGLLADTSIQHQLVEVMTEAEMNVKYEILWKYIAYGNTNETVVLDLLRMFNDQNIGVGAYNLILRLVKPEYLKENEEIAQIIHHLSEHENGYVRNLTRKLIEKNSTTDVK